MAVVGSARRCRGRPGHGERHPPEAGGPDRRRPPRLPHRRVLRRGADPQRSTRTALASVRRSTPSCRNLPAMSSPTSGSSRGSTRASISITVTLLPRRENACPSSQPIGPAPRITSRAGNVSRPHTVSVVSGAASARPSIGGMTGSEPVAMSTARGASIRSDSFRRTERGAVNTASSASTSTPSRRRRSGESCG